MIKSLKSVFEVKHLRKKIIATLLLVLVYKILSVIPVPGADTTQLASIFKDGGNSGLSFFSALM
jgi:preprotein translocase subunit SecY